MIMRDGNGGKILLKIEYIPDDETEVYFKAADLLVLPYRYIYQSGVLFLSYGFGLPVVATDVGSLREDVIEGRTGFLCRPDDPEDLAQTIQRYFASAVYQRLHDTRKAIAIPAEVPYSWDAVGAMTYQVYRGVLTDQARQQLETRP